MRARRFLVSNLVVGRLYFSPDAAVAGFDCLFCHVGKWHFLLLLLLLLFYLALALKSQHFIQAGFSLYKK